MAEVVAAVGAVAAFSQISSQIFTITKIVADLSNNFDKAIHEIQYSSRKVALLAKSMEALQNDVDAIAARNLISGNTIESIRCHTSRTVEIATDIRSLCENLATSSTTIRSKIKWAAVQERKVRKMFASLKDVESSLILSLQLIWIDSLVLRTTEVKEKAKTHHSCTEDVDKAIPTEGMKVSRLRPRSSNYRNSTSSAIVSKTSMLGTGAGSRVLGTFVVITRTSYQSDKRWIFHVGMKLPRLGISKVITFGWDMTLGNFSCLDISLLGGYLRMQNQVSWDSPLMKACGLADVQILRNCLENRLGSVRDRTLRHGKTPLLLAVESGSIECVKLLLDAGADPTVGSDSLRLPIFAASELGFMYEKPGLAPRNEILKLLLQHGASIHEIVNGETVAMAYRGPSKGKFVDFLYVLEEELFADWNIQDASGWSVIRHAILCEDPKIAMRIISRNGGDITRLEPDGANALFSAMHRACCEPMIALEELYYTYGVTDVNKRDAYGWTPLHNSVDFAAYGRIRARKDRQEKVNFLLERGADPALTGVANRHGIFKNSEMENLWVTPYEVSVLVGIDESNILGNSLRKHGYQAMVHIGLPIFFDAEACEVCPACCSARRKEREKTVIDAKLGEAETDESYRWLGPVAIDLFGWNVAESEMETP